MLHFKNIFIVTLFSIYTSTYAQTINIHITQNNIADTICKKNYTKTVRPSVIYTNNYKRILLTAAGISWANAPLYELDHIIPLELGGNPTDHANLQLQLWTGPTGAHAKDVMENKYHRAVCSGKISLQAAQQYFTINGIVTK